MINNHTGKYTGKFKEFILMGAVCASMWSGFFCYIGMEQRVAYDYLITTPLDAIQNSIGLDDGVKNKFKKYIGNDIKFLSSMGAPDDVEVIYKYHQKIDKFFYPFMKMGQYVARYSEAQKMDMQNRYQGNDASYFHIRKDFIMMGINALQNAGNYAKTFSGSGQTESPEMSIQKMTSFIFFHEYGHKYSVDRDIMDEFNKKLEASHRMLTEQEKDIACSQYLETYADTFALMMFVKKYPDVSFETISGALAQVRKEEETHFTTPGLIQIKKIGQNLEEIHSLSMESASITLETSLNKKTSKISKSMS